MSNISETLQLIQKSHTVPHAQRMEKGSWRTDSPSDTPTRGPKFYNLDTVVQQLYPVVVPLLKLIPRVKSNGGNAINFKQITAVNPSSVFSGGVEGQRGAVIDHTFRDVTKKYVTSILEDRVTWQSELASQGLTPQNRALATQVLINSFVLDEHKNVIGANGTLALGTTPTPVGVAVADASSTLAADDYVVICCALTNEGFLKSSLAGGVKLSYTQANSMGVNMTVPGGHAIKSAASSAITVTSGQAIDVAVTDVKGAAGYAWFIGDAAGTARLTALTRGNTVRLTSASGSGQLASAVPATDTSANPYRFDGILSQLQEAGSGAIVVSLDGATLTPNGSGGLVEIDEVLQQAYDQSKISFTRMHVSAKGRNAINKAILGAPAGSGAARMLLENGNNGTKVGTFVVEYLNPITGVGLSLETLPDLPDNMILLWSDRVDYAVPDTQNLIEMVLNSDYYQIEFPMIALTYDIGVATYGTLSVRFPPAFALLKNVGF